MKAQKMFSVFSDLMWVGQLGLSLVLPPILCLLFCRWLVLRVNMGEWVYLVGLIFGIGASVITFRSFFQMMKKRAEKKKEESTSAFNQH